MQDKSFDEITIEDYEETCGALMVTLDRPLTQGEVNIIVKRLQKEILSNFGGINITTVQSHNFDPDWGGVCIYQP